MLEFLIYLWTRDAEMKPDQETEDYIIQHLKAFDVNSEPMLYSDQARLRMSERIADKLQLN